MVIENAFHVGFDRPRLQALEARHTFKIFEVYLTADLNTLTERFEGRVGTSERHPGHGELVQNESLEAILTAGTYDPLDLGGCKITVDTTDFDAVDWSGVLDKVRQAVS